MKTSRAVLCFVLVALIGCSESRKAAGIAEWESVIRVTEDMLFRGDSAPLLRHSDVSGMPNKKRKEIEAALRTWSGVSKNLKFDRVEIVEAKDFKPRKDVPEDIAKHFAPMKWSQPPEKFIVYYFSGPDETTARWSFGVFQEKGFWLFSAGYHE